MSLKSTFYSKSATATSDSPFQVDDTPSTVLGSCNIHCYTQDAKYGNSDIIDGVVRANAVVWYERPVKVSDIWFKNFTAGSNTTITIVGTIDKE